LGNNREDINNFLVKLFNNILKIEENALKKGEFRDLSVREAHILEAIGQGSETNKLMPTNIARTLSITPGTLTVAMKALERKGYLDRNKSLADGRVVEVKLTPKGVSANIWHAKFHASLVDAVVANLSGVELEAFTDGLKKITTYFDSVKTID